jgi:sugar O-acyltransferase (sialic acid O-acetyltransferase NeuD family)
LTVPDPAPSVRLPTLLLFGAGGHARVAADAAMLMPATWGRMLASDRDPARCTGELLPGVPLVALQVARGLDARVHVGIGDNAAREREAESWGMDRLVSLLHPRASVSRHAVLQAGCLIAAQAVIGPGARVGAGAIVNHGAVVDHDVQVGAFAHVAPNATLGGAARIGQRVLVGAGAVVLPGLTLADDVVIGAGAVVCASLDASGVYAGVPARRVK